jgi:predicted AAA+ superfamily ATPase
MGIIIFKIKRACSARILNDVVFEFIIMEGQDDIVKRRTSKIEHTLKKDKKDYEKLMSEPKVLVLGTADCGKSTLMKQLKLIHGNGLFDTDMKIFVKAIKNNILTSCDVLFSNLPNHDRDV